jgi:DNA topoisomerase-3
MRLVIAEKPSVAQSIGAVLGANSRKDGYMEGSGYIVTWCVGHLVGLAPADYYDEKYAKWQYKDLPILPQNWKYVISKGKEKQMKIIGQLIKQREVKEIIAATDSGREGELIFRLVYEKLRCKKPIKRLWISSMEESAIAKGFENLRNGADYELLYHSALCRAKADWIVGINATRLFSVLYRQTLNVGRVMTPTLAMIVERQVNISEFKAEPFYIVQLDCGDFILSSERIKDKGMAETLCKSCNGQTITIEKVEEKERIEKPPKLYDLTTLQREANRQLGFTANQTLEYTQSLYEKKLVTYPRTDSRYLTEDMKDSIPALVNINAGIFLSQDTNLPINIGQVIDNSKVSDHHGIITTMGIESYDIHSLPFGEKEILKMVAIGLICAVGDNHYYAETIITVNCNETTFTAKGKTVLAEGFKAVENLYLKNKKKKKQAKDDKDKALPPISQGEVFTAKASIKEGKTSPPKHYTDDTLLSAMENANNALEDMERKGIGTPATRAGILEKLIKTGFVERKGDKKTKHFIPTHKGISLITILPEIIQSPILTAEWEEKLQQIEQGGLSPEEFLQEINEMIESLVRTYEVIKGTDDLFPSNKEGIGKCPRCGGNVVENRKGFCCGNKDCAFALWKENKFFTMKKKTLTKEIAIKLLKDGRVKLTGCYSGKTGKTYDAIVILDDNGGKYVNFKIEFPTKKGR